MKRWIKNFLLNRSGSPSFQRWLERVIDFSQYLMGIGSGSDPGSSGENVLVEKLEQQYYRVNRPLRVFDVGSNKGQFLNLLVSGLGNRNIPFYAHAFEPSRITYDILYENFKNYPNLTLNNFGLGKVSGEFELFYNEIGSGLASLYKRRLDHLGIEFKYSETVTIQSIDDYCINQGVESIDLLKLDVEGNELDVLMGAVNMLAERRIRMVSFEFGGCNIDSRTYLQDFWYFFQEQGMKNLFRITPSGHLIAIPHYNEVYEQFRTTNFLVLQSEI